MNKSCHTHGYVMSHSWISHATLTNMSIHTWMSDFTHGGVISNMNESCHTYQRFIDPTLRVVMNESCHVWMSHVTYEWGMSGMSEVCHVWMSHVTHINDSLILRCGSARSVRSHTNESCHPWTCHVTYEWFMSHIRISHTRYIMKESCHVWMSHVMYEWMMSRMNESCHVCMSHVTLELVTSCMHESCHTYESVTPDTLGMSHIMYKWVMSRLN